MGVELDLNEGVAQGLPPRLPDAGALPLRVKQNGYFYSPLDSIRLPNVGTDS